MESRSRGGGGGGGESGDSELRRQQSVSAITNHHDEALGVLEAGDIMQGKLLLQKVGARVCAVFVECCYVPICLLS